MKNFRSMLPYLAVLATAFYLVPYALQLMPDKTKGAGTEMLFFLIALPAICFITAFLYGAKNGFHWLYGLSAAALFVPTIFIFYNESASVYAVMFGAISFTGNFFGNLLDSVADKK